jgi:hypothetical protein
VVGGRVTRITDRRATDRPAVARSPVRSLCA